MPQSSTQSEFREASKAACRARNHNAWVAIGDFLTVQDLAIRGKSALRAINLGDDVDTAPTAAAAGKRSAAAAAAVLNSQAVPVGNTGTTFKKHAL